jgi:putative transcriptional regulator
MFGLGKNRSYLGKFLDQNGITQQWLQNKTNISGVTITELCRDDEYYPRSSTRIKIVGALRREGFDVEIDDFW